MKKSIILTTAMVIMIISTTVLIAKNHNLLQKDVEKNSDQITVSDNKEDEIAPESEPEDSEADVSTPENEEENIVTEESVTYNMGEECELFNWKYLLKAVNVTKSCEGMTPYYNEHFPTNENGDFICEYSFLTADMEVTNNTDTARSVYINGICIQLYNYVNGEVSFVDSNGLDMYNFNGENVRSKSYFKCDFEPGETKSFRLGFKAKDDLLDRKFQLIRMEVYNEGNGILTENLRFYKLGENICLNDLRQSSE